MRKIKIAQIGTSAYSHGFTVFQSLAKQKDIFEVIGYALPENEREQCPAHVLQPFEGFREMTVEEILNSPEIEAVAVETEEIYLTKYAQMAADSGKHIHLEKPGSQNLANFERLIETVRKNKIVFHIGYMYRYNPFIIELFEQIKKGELGEIISVEAQMNCIHPLEMRQWLSNFQGGMMFFLGCHLIDLILRIQGKPEKVISLNKATGLDGATGEDFGMAVLKYKNGVSFAKTIDIQRGGFARRELVVTGSKKTVELCPLEMYCNGGLFTTKTEYATSEWGDRGKTSSCDAFDRYDAMMASFAAMVRGETENPYTLDYELELYKTILKCCGVNEE